MSRLRGVSRRLGWPSLFRSLVEARLTARHYRDSLFMQPPLRTRIAGLRRYARDRASYQRLAGPLRRYDDNPQLLDWLPTTPYDPHYLHQDAWAARELAQRGVRSHVDVGSRLSFVCGIAAFTEVTFVDIRPLDAEVPNLRSVAGSVLEMPFEERSLESLSCLHVAEHIGLGRYGDPLDPEGTRKAARELERVLAPGGTLLFALPVGEPRTNFNAHRVHDPREVPAMFEELSLAGFAAVDDDGRFVPDARPEQFAGARWSCGMYRLVREG